MNYVVVRGQLGGYGEGSVLPGFVFEEAGGSNPAARAAVVEEMVARGQIQPTDAPVNRDIAKPQPKGAAADPQADVRVELDRLRKERDDLAADRDAHKGRAELAETSRAALQTEIARYVEENSHLRTVADGRRVAAEGAAGRVAALESEVADLKAQIDTLTAPPAKKTTVAA